jgi:hypothetical protein
MVGRYIRAPVLTSAYGVLVRFQSAVMRVTAVISKAATTGTQTSSTQSSGGTCSDALGQLHATTAVEKDPDRNQGKRAADQATLHAAEQGVAFELARQILVGRAHAAQELDGVGAHAQSDAGDQPGERERAEQGADAGGAAPGPKKRGGALGAVAGQSFDADRGAFDDLGQPLLEGGQVGSGLWLDGDVDQPRQRQIHVAVGGTEPRLDQGFQLLGRHRDRRGHPARPAQEIDRLRQLLIASAAVLDRWQGHRDQLATQVVQTERFVGDGRDRQRDHGEVQQSADGPGQKAAGGTVAKRQIETAQVHAAVCQSAAASAESGCTGPVSRPFARCRTGCG